MKKYRVQNKETFRLDLDSMLTFQIQGRLREDLWDATSQKNLLILYHMLLLRLKYDIKKEYAKI